MKNYTIERQARVKFQGELSSYRIFEMACPRVEFFNILVENLALLPLPPGVRILMHADDVVAEWLFSHVSVSLAVSSSFAQGLLVFH